MITYALRLLDIDEAVEIIKGKIERPDYPNVVKQGLSQFTAAIRDAKLCQTINVHREVASGLCSCSLQISVAEGEKSAIAKERLFRTRGHVDHSKGKLTRIFIRKWPAINTDGEFYCWWCLECGYLGEASLSNPKPPIHQCRSEGYRRDLVRMLAGSSPRIGHAHWIHATKHFKKVVESSLDDESEFIEFRQEPGELEPHSKSWFVFCVECDSKVSELFAENEWWLYEFRERHRANHLSEEPVELLEHDGESEEP